MHDKGSFICEARNSRDRRKETFRTSYVQDAAQRNDTYFMKSVVYSTCLNYFREIEMLHLTRKT